MDSLDSDDGGVLCVVQSTHNICNSAVCEAYFSMNGLRSKESKFLEGPYDPQLTAEFYMDHSGPSIPNWLTNNEGVSQKNQKFWNNSMPIDVRTGIQTLWNLAYMYKKNILWAHIIVPHNEWQKFMDIYHKLKKDMYILPYFCLCRSTEIPKKCHRHSIIVLNRTKRVRFNFTNYYMNPQKEPCHLLSVLRYITDVKIDQNAHYLNVQGIYFGQKHCSTAYRYYVSHTMIPYAEYFQLILTPNGVKNYLKYYKNPIKNLVFPLPRHCVLKYIGLTDNANNMAESAFLFYDNMVFTYEIKADLIALDTLSWNQQQIQAKYRPLELLQGISHIMQRINTEMEKLKILTAV